MLDQNDNLRRSEQNVRLKWKTVPTMRVREKGAPKDSPVLVINKDNFDPEKYTKVGGRVSLKEQKEQKEKSETETS